MKVSIEHWCNDPDRGKQNYSESLAMLHKSKPGLRGQRAAINSLRRDTAFKA